MLAPPPAPLRPFTLCETPGIFELPGCRVRRSSAELEWSSLFLSEQDEAPLSAEVNATKDHLIVMHLSDPVRVEPARKRVWLGKGVSGRVEPGGSRTQKKK